MKLFCGDDASGRNGQIAARGGCCEAEPMTSCCRKSELDGTRMCSQSCTRVSNAQTSATVPTIANAKPESTLAFDSFLHPFASTFANAAAATEVDRQTGPPPDLVIELHCLLI
jgi:hypothetical protein